MAAGTCRKRIVVCCDGTWMDSDGTVQAPSNVTRFSRAVSPLGWDNSTSPPTPIPQLIFYQNGVGTGSNSLHTKYIGGATGEGMSLNVREAYSFVCLNYREGDEIFLIGFSRGAFTARSVASLIRTIGLLTPAGLSYLTQIFEDWKFQNKSGWKSKYQNIPWPNRVKLETKEYRRTLLEKELTRLDIPIKCVALWDTVGSLGVPSIFLFSQKPPIDYQLVNNCVEPNIEYAFQALALDERRRPYHPTLWEKPDGQALPKVFKQTWFPGVHSDVGGSYKDSDLSNLTLAWMITQLDPLLTFNHEMVTRAIRENKERHHMKMRALREWGLGKIHNSMSFVFKLFGVKNRSPMEYYRIGPRNNTNQRERLKNTNEFIHSSVRIRMGKPGLGYNDRGIYDSPALAGWNFTGTETAADTPIAKRLPGAAGKMKDVIWKKEVNVNNGKGQTEKLTLEMPEDVLEGYEKQILALWPQVLKDFDTMKPGKHPATIIRAHTFPEDTKKSTPLLTSPSPKNSPAFRFAQLNGTIRTESPERRETS